MPTSLNIQIAGHVDPSFGTAIDRAVSGLDRLQMSIAKVHMLSSRLGRVLGSDLAAATAAAAVLYSQVGRYTMRTMQMTPGAVVASGQLAALFSRHLIPAARTFALSLARAAPYIAALTAAAIAAREGLQLMRAQKSAAQAALNLRQSENRLFAAIEQRIDAELKLRNITEEQATELRRRLYEAYGAPEPIAAMREVAGFFTRGGGPADFMERMRYRLRLGEATALGMEWTPQQQREQLEIQLRTVDRMLNVWAERAPGELWQVQEPQTAEELQKRTQWLERWIELLQQRKQISEEIARIDRESLEREADAARIIAEAHVQSVRQRLEAQQFLLGHSEQMLGALANLASMYGRKGFIAWKALQIAQALINTYQAVIAAFASQVWVPGVGPVLAKAAAAMALATGMAQVAAIAATQPPSYQTGGYTGSGAPWEPAGIVHRGEYVVPAPVVQQIGVPALDALRAGLRPSREPIHLVVVKDYSEAEEYIRSSRGRAAIIRLVGEHRYLIA